MRSLYILSICLICCTLGGSMAYASDVRDEITKELSPFKEVVFNGNFDVTLIPGSTEKMILEGRDRSLEDIKIVEKDGKVIVKYRDEDRWRGGRRVFIKLHYRTLHRLELNGLSHLVCEGPIRSAQLDLECNGIRDLVLPLEVGTFTALFHGIGRASLYGRAQTANIEYTGIGNLQAYDLVTDEMKVASTGIGRIEVHAQKKLIVSATGIGSVRYLGDPKIKRLNGSGIGKIKAVR